MNAHRLTMLTMRTVNNQQLVSMKQSTMTFCFLMKSEAIMESLKLAYIFRNIINQILQCSCQILPRIRQQVNSCFSFSREMELGVTGLVSYRSLLFCRLFFPLAHSLTHSLTTFVGCLSSKYL